MTWLLSRSAWHDVGGTYTPEWRRLNRREGLERDEQWRPEGHQDTRMSSTRNTFPIVWNRLLRAIGMTVLVCVSACTAIDRPRSPLSDARILWGHEASRAGPDSEPRRGPGRGRTCARLRV